jgi:hypothetical protein
LTLIAAFAIAGNLQAWVEPAPEFEISSSGRIACERKKWLLDTLNFLGDSKKMENYVLARRCYILPQTKGRLLTREITDEYDISEVLIHAIISEDSGVGELRNAIFAKKLWIVTDAIDSFQKRAAPAFESSEDSTGNLDDVTENAAEPMEIAE